MKNIKYLLLVLLCLFVLASCSCSCKKDNQNGNNPQEIVDPTGDADPDPNADPNPEPVDNSIKLGRYPQTLETDEAVIANLTSLAGELPTQSNHGNWTWYHYYLKTYMTDYMFYIDLDLNQDGLYDYRGVYFNYYRATGAAGDPKWEELAKYSQQDDNHYLTEHVYFFKYEPVQWVELKVEEGKSLLMAKLIIDSQEFYPSENGAPYDHNGGNGYSNNYELSQIRIWLNNDFYNTAFDTTDKAKILETTVDNSTASGTHRKYACNDINDYIFLASYNEIFTNITEEANRIAYGTDYAKCQGLYVDTQTGSSAYRLRSCGDAGDNYSLAVSTEGTRTFYTTAQTFIGIRPLIWVTNN